MNLTNSTETNSVETLANRLAVIGAARNDFNAQPLVAIRRNLRSNGQRFATVEQVDAHKAREFGAATYAAKMDFAATVRAEAGVGLSAKELAELEEQERLAREKVENAELEAEFAKAVEAD